MNPKSLRKVKRPNPPRLEILNFESYAKIARIDLMYEICFF